MRRLLAWCAGFGLAGVVAVAALNAYVLARAGDGAREVQDVRRAQVAIVPGALVNPDGTMSAMLRDRVGRAVELFEAGKVQRILVSGDHGRRGYDEPDTMRDALLRAGIPPRAIFTDYAGFDTWSTMVRAREVFKVRDAIVVTQGFHMARSLYLAQQAGLDAQGLVADRSSYGGKGTQSGVREVLARIKGVQQGTLKPGVLGGPPHPITGDGRTSWGPADPGAP